MSENPRIFVEAYVETREQGEAAMAAGADRLELCGPGEGGLTPDYATLGWLATSQAYPVHAMLRPRAGDFVYDADEFEQMRRAIPRLRQHGGRGVVFGILREDGSLDVERMAELTALADGMHVVCHRAFDATPDADEALAQLIALRVHEVLTSGHAATASEGTATLRRLKQIANGRIAILAGGSVRAHNVRELVAASGVQRVHARATDAAVIADIRRALDDAPST
ncbi:MAG: copper homeostasis protein CutC [Gemmatimonas sp.]|nr:copper homeostasis protein CutC [Gemmatimonas sp.]